MPTSTRTRVLTDKSMFLGDAHYPYHDKSAIAVMLRFAHWYRPSTVFVIGDWLDMYQVSRFDQDPHRILELQDDIDEAVDGLRELRGAVGEECKLIYISGNHEARLERWLWKHPEVANLRSLSFPNLMNLRELGIKNYPYGTQHKWHGFIVEHGNLVRKHSGATAAAMLASRGVSGLSGHTHRLASHYHRDNTGQKVWFENGCLCYDSETEVLTQNGFKKFADLMPDDRVGNWNPATEDIHLAKPLAYQTRDYCGPMLKVTGKRFDLMVTPEHKVGYYRRDGKFTTRSAERYAASPCYIMPTSGMFVGDGPSWPVDWASLAGWLVSEGSVDRNALSPRVSIYQKKTEQCKEIERVLAGLELDYSIATDNRSGVRKYSLHAESSAFVLQAMGDELRKLPRSLLNSGQESLSATFRAMMAGDGHTGQCGSRYYPSINVGLIEDFVELCHKLGYGTRVVHRRAPTSFKADAEIYLCKVYRGPRASPKSAIWVQYSGKVYDVTSETGFLVVRRNGVICISGNCDLDPEYAHGVTNWQHGFTIGAAIRGKTRFTMEQVPIVDRKILYAGHVWEST